MANTLRRGDCGRMISLKRFAVVLLLAAVAVTAALVLRPHAGNPLSGLRSPAAEEARYDATVRQRLPAGPYTYLQLERDSGALAWAVSTERPALGARVHVEVFGLSERFESRRLHRVFSPLSFASVHPHQESP